MTPLTLVALETEAEIDEAPSSEEDWPDVIGDAGDLPM